MGQQPAIKGGEIGALVDLFRISRKKSTEAGAAVDASIRALLDRARLNFETWGTG